jgi:hypothetical protein
MNVFDLSVGPFYAKMIRFKDIRGEVEDSATEILDKSKYFSGQGVKLYIDYFVLVSKTFKNSIPERVYVTSN